MRVRTWGLVGSALFFGAACGGASETEGVSRDAVLPDSFDGWIGEKFVAETEGATFASFAWLDAPDDPSFFRYVADLSSGVTERGRARGFRFRGLTHDGWLQFLADDGTGRFFYWNLVDECRLEMVSGGRSESYRLARCDREDTVSPPAFCEDVAPIVVPGAEIWNERFEGRYALAGNEQGQARFRSLHLERTLSAPRHGGYESGRYRAVRTEGSISAGDYDVHLFEARNRYGYDGWLRLAGDAVYLNVVVDGCRVILAAGYPTYGRYEADACDRAPDTSIDPSAWIGDLPVGRFSLAYELEAKRCASEVCTEDRCESREFSGRGLFRNFRLTRDAPGQAIVFHFPRPRGAGRSLVPADVACSGAIQGHYQETATGPEATQQSWAYGNIGRGQTLSVTFERDTPDFGYPPWGGQNKTTRDFLRCSFEGAPTP